METTMERARGKATKRPYMPADTCAGLPSLQTAGVDALRNLIDGIVTKSHPLTCKGCRDLLDQVAAIVRRAEGLPVRPMKRLGKASGA